MGMNLLTLLKILLKSIASLVVTLIFIALILVGTEFGTAWLVNTALNRVNGPELTITVSGLEGTLFNTLKAQELNVQSGGTRLSVGNLVFAWNPLALTDSVLEIRELSANRLLLRLQAGDTDTASDPQEQLAALFNLPLAVNIDSLVLGGIEVSGDSPLSLQSVTGHASLDSEQLGLALVITRSAQTSMDIDVTLGSAGLAVNGTIGWQAVVQDMAAAGNLEVGGTLAQLTLDHRLTAPIDVRSTGTLNPGLLDNSVLAFDLVHDIGAFSSDALNLAGFSSARGRVAMAGSVDNFQLDGEVVVAVPDLGDVAITLDTGVANTVLTMRTLTATNDLFNLAGSGTVDLAPALAVNLDWSLADFSDGDLVPQVVLENLAGNGSVAVNTANGETVAAFSIARLTGQLNGYALTGSGDVTLVDGSPGAISLALESGGNALQLAGSLMPTLDLRWTLQAPALERVLNGLDGIVSGQGLLTGTPQAPRINGSLAGEGLVYRNGDSEYRIDSVNGSASYSGEENRVDLSFAGLSLNTSSWQLTQAQGDLSLSGTPAAHSFSLATRDSDPALSLAGEGQWDSGSWQGVLASARVDSSYGNWQLQEPAPLALAAGAATIGSQCWRVAGMTLCGAAAWSAGDGLAGSLDLDNLPLAWFNDGIPDGVSGLEQILASQAQRPPGIGLELDRYALHMPENSLLEGMLDLTVNFTGVGLTADRLNLDAVISPRDISLGLIRPVANQDTGEEGLRVERYGLDDVMLNVSRANSRWQLDSSLSIYLAESGGLDFQGDFRGMFSLGDDETLAGNFTLTFNSIAWLEALAPSLRNVSGALGADGQISGNLQRPLLQVDAALADGGVELPEYGLVLSGIGLTFHSEGENEMTVTGVASSGDGVINLSSQLTTPFLPARSVHVEISGQDFLAYNQPEVRLLVNPALQLDYRDNVMMIGGELMVPSMQVDLRDSQALIGSGATSVSRDVVIVTTPEGGVPRQSEAGERLGRIPVSGEIRLGMGDDVRFQGFGLDVKLTGNLMLEQTVDRPLLALGELSIPTGSYGLYGQQLAISDGKLLFLGNPLNPALDIQATRKTADAEVGILMNGTVSHINAQLFSTPTLPESEILSLLITGNSFSTITDSGSQDSQNMLGAIALLGLEKGQGLTGSVSSKLGLDTVAISSNGSDYRDSALGLGKYINPNLFMRYDIGLFDRENVLTLNYILSERLRLEVETGVSQSVDLTYTVEK